MAERYGVVPPRGRRLAIAALVAVTAVLLGWLAWSAWVHATRTVTAEVVSFDVVSAHQVDVAIAVHRPGSSAVRCTVQAQAVDHSIVGMVDVFVEAGTDTDVQIDTTVTTEREATAASVTDCR